MDHLSLFVTIKLALVTTAVLIMLAIPVAYFLAYIRFSGKSFVEVLFLDDEILPFFERAG